MPKQYSLPRFLFYILIHLLPVSLYAQQFNYVHYDTKDGMAGSTVYDMSQDRDGFMWFATENGLSRYDGTNFRNFTVKDGLPDNEVLKVFSDSRGRTWVGTFNKDICYYFKGKFYNKHNDSTVAAISLNNNLMGAHEHANGLLILIGYNSLTTITKDNRVKNFSSKELFGRDVQIKHIFFHDRVFFSGAIDINAPYYILNNDNSVSTVDSYDIKFLFHLIGTANDFYPFSFDSNGVVKKKIRLASKDIISTESNSYTLQYINSTDGSWDIDTVSMKLNNHFLPGKRVSRTISDRENNLWFATSGDGVYKLPSREIRTLTGNGDASGSKNEIFSIAGNGTKLLAGTLYSKMLITQKAGSFTNVDFTNHFEKRRSLQRANRLYTISILSSGAAVLGFDAFLAKFEAGKTTISNIMPIKSIAEVDRDYIAAGTSRYVFKLAVTDLSIADTIWYGRCTKLFFHNNYYYIGTINGLYRVDAGKNPFFQGSIHPTLTRRITDIKASADGQLWVASSDNGIVAIKNGQVTHVIKDSNGLSSNICRSLFLQGNYLWVGTNKGLNKIDISKQDLPVIRYSTSDGLPSDIINTVYVQDSTIWVGTPAGLTWFNENKISGSSICNLHLLGITVSGREIPLSSSYQLAYTNNNISFSYVAVSFKSGGEINYHYRLTGLHSNWRQTNLTSLDYQLLPPGEYELELYAVNKFGLKSETIKIPFTISTPYWKAWWFYLLLFALTTAGAIIWLQKKAARQRRALEEKNKTQQQFAALEQQALQAQMNPHFIFNCLNSIQQYNLTADKEKANEYLTGFASLVRQTLDYSGKKTITVAQEAAYLHQYLEMEKMRFAGNFSYSIDIDEAVKADFFEMPALLLQPFVENALRHGIRYKQDGSGRVSIQFYMDDKVLNCAIKDNGVGRAKAAAYKGQQHIEYQSKGMSLTQKRVELLNKVNNTNMEITINDLTDAEGNASGTEIIIKIPV